MTLEELAATLTFTKYSSEELSVLYNEGFKIGAILKLHDDKLALVGNINRYCGVCDDCVNIEASDIKEIAYLLD